MADDSSILDDSPGGFAAGQSNGDGSLPQDSGGVLANLDANFQPNLDNLLPAATLSNPSDSLNNSMDDLFGLLDGSGSLNAPGTIQLGFGSSALPDVGSSFNGTSLLTGLEGIGNNLLGAFVTNPQNAQTAEQEALQQAAINQSGTSQIFSYLIIGLVIFLVFTFVEKK